jgi:hypothetical protein
MTVEYKSLFYKTVVRAANSKHCLSWPHRCDYEYATHLTCTDSAEAREAIVDVMAEYLGYCNLWTLLCKALWDIQMTGL